MSETDKTHTAKRAGSVVLVGRSNAGKSTLMNRCLGEKLAIVSDKPQTTRQRLVGILNGERGQMVFYDTPGTHKPLHRMNRNMMQYALSAMNDADVVCVLADASQSLGQGDKYLIELVSQASGPKVLALNKIDRVQKQTLLPRIAHYDKAASFAGIVPLSALTGDGVDILLDLLWGLLPEGEPIYDPELWTIHPERFLVAERIREKLLDATRDELPFTTAVILDHWEEEGPREGEGRVRIFATILVERKGQKKIVVGKGGQMIRDIGIAARLDLQKFLGRSVHLELHVRHEPDWREDRHLLARLDRDAEATS